MINKLPNVAGMFYPENKEDLIQMIEFFFSKIKINNKILSLVPFLKATVVPHAGYYYSGQVASYGYFLLQEYISSILQQKSQLPTFIILAPSHYHFFSGISVGLFHTFTTPLGEMQTDMVLGKKLIHQYPSVFSFFPKVFEKEHSYEVQLPFLQYIYPGGLKVLPLLFGKVNVIEIGEILFEFTKKEKIFFIVSSDLSHFMDYQTAVKKDKQTLNAFMRKDLSQIIEKADACGGIPRATLTQIAIQAHRKVKLLKYLNSGDITGENSQVVGYGSLIYY